MSPTITNSTSGHPNMLRKPTNQSDSIRNDRNGGFEKTNEDYNSREKTESEQPTSPKKSKYDTGWRHIVRNFSPSWFSVTMGTGIVAILLASIPFPHAILHYASIIFFILNTIIFFTFSGISLLRYTLYPAIFSVMIRDPNNSLFISTWTMGGATLINMWMLVCVPAWGHWAITFALVTWILDTICAVAVTFCLPMILMSRDDIRSLDRITATQLLPIASTVVACGIGARLANVVLDPQVALGIIITCYILFGMSLLFAMMQLTLYYHRLIVHKLPAKEVIVSAFLPLGPCGYSATILLLLGNAARKTFPLTNTLGNPLAGELIHAISLPCALMLWGFGLLWAFFALAAIYRSRPFPFNMGWWGFTFPLGVYSAATIQLGVEIPSFFFRVLGTIFSVAVFLLWILVAVRTVEGAWSRKLFYAPCLANLASEKLSVETLSTVA